jgi:hypothetical protein
MRDRRDDGVVMREAFDVRENKMAAGAIGPRRPLPSEKGIRDGCEKLVAERGPRL